MRCMVQTSSIQSVKVIKEMDSFLVIRRRMEMEELQGNTEDLKERKTQR